MVRPLGIRPPNPFHRSGYGRMILCAATCSGMSGFLGCGEKSGQLCPGKGVRSSSLAGRVRVLGAAGVCAGSVVCGVLVGFGGVGVFCGEQPRSVRESFQVAAGPFAVRVAVDESPELWSVAGDDEVDEFVHEHVVEDPAGHACQAVRDPDRLLGRLAGAPPDPRVVRPADA